MCAIKSLRSLVLKSAWRGHTRYSLYKLSQNLHNSYCTLLTVVWWAKYTHTRKTTDFSMLHRHLMFSFVLLVQQTGTIIDDMYVSMYVWS